MLDELAGELFSAGKFLVNNAAAIGENVSRLDVRR